MKKVLIFVIVLLAGFELSAQTIVRIGEAEFALRSPIKISKDTTKKSYNNSYGHYNRGHYPKRVVKNFTEFYAGLGFAMNTKEESYMPLYFGNSYNFEFGWRYMYKPSKSYAIGTFFQYSYYNYRLKDAAVNDAIVSGVPGDVQKEYFRTDNLGTGIINRIYLFPVGYGKPVHIDFGGYVDYSFSKRYKVKTVINGDKDKIKYRDGSKFNPIQAGLHGAVGVGGVNVYVRYRLTNLFNQDFNIAELPRWTLGVQIDLD